VRWRIVEFVGEVLRRERGRDFVGLTAAVR
jgi:hypothetical protein